jgi:hypothetical protein
MQKLWIVTVAALVVCFGVPAHAQQRIGSATAVKPEAKGSAAGQLSAGSSVHANESVTTGSSGQANLQFLDNTKLSVGPTSTVRLDKFVYDPNKSKGSVVVNATRRSYRFATGVRRRREGLAERLARIKNNRIFAINECYG